MTRQQETILAIIETSEDHLAADEIFTKARAVLPSIALATIYRNLSQLTKAGRIRRITMQRGPDRFDKTLARHEHLICTECGALSDAYLGDLQEFLSAKTEVTILDYDIHMRYICQQCRQKKEEVK